MTNEEKRIELKRNTAFAKARMIRDLTKLKNSIKTTKEFLEKKHGKVGTVAAAIVIPIGVTIGTVVGLYKVASKKFKKA